MRQAAAPLTLRQRLERFTLTRRRLTRQRLDAFVAAHASDVPALVVHSHDIDHRRHFPYAFVVSCDERRRPDLVAERHYLAALGTLPSASRRLIVCTGLLEHLPEPGRAVEEFARILEPGGTLLLSASAVFSYHGAPDNFFHFAPGGFRRLLDGHFELVELAGSTGPFETLGVLAQRISLQCDVAPPVRLLLDGLTRGLPLLDRFVRRQYDNLARVAPADERIGVMPATLLAVARRPLEAGT
jgi:SAM-dependent methyltransferase